MKTTKKTAGTIKSKDGRETITVDEFDTKFDKGEAIDTFLDLSKARRPGREVVRVNIDFSKPILCDLDQMARHMGVTRQSLVKVWISERIQQEKIALKP
jgi:hypothetical protein